jgi:hypothetical protein
VSNAREGEEDGSRERRNLDGEVADDDPSLRIKSSCSKFWWVSKASCSTTHCTEETTECLLEMVWMVTQYGDQALSVESCEAEQRGGQEGRQT